MRPEEYLKVHRIFERAKVQFDMHLDTAAEEDYCDALSDARQELEEKTLYMAVFEIGNTDSKIFTEFVKLVFEQADIDDLIVLVHQWATEREI
jgi:hypothetical protein